MQNFGGISRYFFELMNNSNTVGFDYELSLLLSSNEYLFESARVSHALRLPGFAKKLYRFNNLINMKYSQFKIDNNNYDLLHPTFYEDYFVGNIKKPYVLTVHDLINEKLPQYFKSNARIIEQKKNLIKNATRIIAVSENTKKDIIEHFNISESKIDVTYLAESISSINSHRVDNLPLQYLLFIGKRGGYKNFENMYSAVKGFLVNDPELYLVCAGGNDFSPQEREQFQLDGVNKKIKHVSFSKNEELKYLYENAIAFIFPSLYEGFGIPVLESFASGCLLCVSHSSSLKEIGGKAALFFDPHSPDEIRNTIKKALSLDKKNKYTATGFQQLEYYNWEKTTKQTFNVYNKC